MMTDDQKLDQRFINQGYSAYCKGLTLAHNPHLAGFTNHECWAVGWRNALDYHNDIKAKVEAETQRLQAITEEARQRRTEKQKRNKANRQIRGDLSRSLQRKKG